MFQPFGAATALEKGCRGFSEFSSGAGLPEEGVHGSLFPSSRCFYSIREVLRRLFFASVKSQMSLP